MRCSRLYSNSVIILSKIESSQLLSLFQLTKRWHSCHTLQTHSLLRNTLFSFLMLLDDDLFSDTSTSSFLFHFYQWLFLALRLCLYAMFTKGSTIIPKIFNYNLQFRYSERMVDSIIPPMHFV